MENTIIFNIILYTMFALYICKRHLDNKCLLFVSCLYLFSALGGYVFYFSDQRDYHNLTYKGFFIFFVFYVISVIPLFYINNKNNVLKINIPFLNKLGSIIYYCSIIPFLFSIVSLISLLSGDVSSVLGEAHDARHADAGYSANPSMFIVSLLIKIPYYCKSYLPFLLFYYIQRDGHFSRKAWGIIMAQVAVLISAMTSSSRTPFVEFALLFLFTYCIAYPYMNKTTKTIYYKIVISFTGLIFVGLLLITFARAYYMGVGNFYGVIEWLSLYTSEGMLNFNEYVLDLHFVKGFYDIAPYLDNQAIRDHATMASYHETTSYWESILGIQDNIFYGSFGAYVKGFGVYISLIGQIVFSLFFIYIIKKSKNSFSGLLLIVFLSQIITMGIIGFPFAGFVGNNTFMQGLMALSVFYYYEKKGKYVEFGKM